MERSFAKLAKRLESRRKRLGMSYAVLALRSGVSEPTVKRILSGRLAEASFANVEAVATALGVSRRYRALKTDELTRREARKKAERIARMVQGTSALESQAVGPEVFNRLVESSYHELMAGSRRRLWSP